MVQQPVHPVEIGIVNDKAQHDKGRDPPERVVVHMIIHQSIFLKRAEPDDHGQRGEDGCGLQGMKDLPPKVFAPGAPLLDLSPPHLFPPPYIINQEGYARQYKIPQ